jgi:hypothetical protein
MVGVLTSPPASLVKGWVCHCSGVKHCMEVLDLRVYLLAIHRQQGHELIDDDLGGQSIVCSRAVNLLTLPLDLTDFFMKLLRSIPESVMACRTLSVELGVMPPRGDIIFSFILGHSQVILLNLMSLSRHLVGIILSLGWCPLEATSSSASSSDAPESSY